MNTIKLPERCDRAAAEALLPEFQEAAGADQLAIDASNVGQIGQAMLQILVSARHGDASVTITPSPALLDAAQLSGLTDALFDESETI